ncbi:MAG: 4-aminobutyrate aminotransferase-like enzyme [Candidatus Omnitrophota bacterium]|jgi:4-aminobutyrate aminotransferase-like enzyme
MLNNPKQALKSKKKYLMPCLYHFYKKPMLLKKGKGIYVYDSDGKRYIDSYSGVGVVNCGHTNPQIVRAAIKQLKTLEHTTTIYLTEPMLKLAKELAQFVGSGLKRSFFCASGSEANEGAMLLARIYTKRPDFIALTGSLHGRTELTTAATGIPFWRTDPFLPKNVNFVPAPNCSQCPIGLKYPTCKIACADEVQKVLVKRPKKIAAMIVEIIQGNGGIQVPPIEYFKKVHTYLKQAGVLLIVDEAQTGFCRTGKRFAFEHYGIKPDILSVCKALGNGLPIAAFMTTDKIAKVYTKPGASTYGGNLVCSEAARATIAFMNRNQLHLKSKALGVFLKKELTQLKKQYKFIGVVRGKGLMIGMELILANGSPASSQMDLMLEELKDKGVLVGKTGPGRNVLTFMPPLTIQKSQIQQLIPIVTAVFKKHVKKFA